METIIVKHGPRKIICTDKSVKWQEMGFRKGGFGSKGYVTHSEVLLSDKEGLEQLVKDWNEMSWKTISTDDIFNNVEEKSMGGIHSGKVLFNPIAGHISSTDWEKPRGDLGKISPPVGKESGRTRKMFRSLSKAQEVLRLTGNPGSNQDPDYFGSRF